MGVEKEESCGAGEGGELWGWRSRRAVGVEKEELWGARGRRAVGWRRRRAGGGEELWGWKWRRAVGSFVDPNTLNLDPGPDPDPVLCYQFKIKNKKLFYIKTIFFTKIIFFKNKNVT